MRLFLLVLPMTFLTAAMAAPATQRDWPDRVTATIGDVTIRFEGEGRLWTAAGIDFRGRNMVVEDSVCGTVVGIKGIGWIGSMHRDHETEQVEAVRYFLDGRPVTDFSKPLVGKSFVFERQSRVHALRLDNRTEITDGRILQTLRLRADADTALDRIYPDMYAWTPLAGEYVFGRDNGPGERGRFFFTKGMRQDLDGGPADYVGVFVPEYGVGAVTRVTRRPALGTHAVLVVDAPHVYRKAYTRHFVNETVPAGFDGTFAVATTFFDADADAWPAKAAAAAASLRP